MGIDDHELTGLAAVTAAAVLIPRNVLSMEFSMNMLILERGDLFMLLDKWNGLAAMWMTDPKLWRVPKGLKPLMDMFSLCPLNLEWFRCTPFRFLLMLTFSNTLIFSSHYLTIGILLFWIMVLPLHFLM